MCNHRAIRSLRPVSTDECLYPTGRLWANANTPGWPNATPIPLLFGLWFGMKASKPKVYLLIITMAGTDDFKGSPVGVAALMTQFALGTKRRIHSDR